MSAESEVRQSLARLEARAVESEARRKSLAILEDIAHYCLIWRTRELERNLDALNFAEHS